MPSRNIVKEYSEESYYHIYTRGINKDQVFLDDADFVFFLSLFKRYLDPKVQVSTSRVPYPNYFDSVHLLAYCLMRNHVHLFIYQKDSRSITKLMRAIMTSYSMYFNRKYNHIGPVFQSRYRAVRIDDPSYYQHISRYIHLNPKDWKEYPYSSILHYRNLPGPRWLYTKTIMSEFNGDIGSYLSFIEDYVDTKDELEALKWELADTGIEL